MPNAHAVAVLIVTILVFYLYTRRWIRMELVSLLLLAALLSIFYVFPYVTSQARITETVVLQSFGHPALVAICSLMVLGRGLTMTGARGHARMVHTHLESKYVAVLPWLT